MGTLRFAEAALLMRLSIAVDLLPSVVWPGQSFAEGEGERGSRAAYVLFVSVFLRSGKHAAGYDQEVDHGQGFWLHSRRARESCSSTTRPWMGSPSKSCAKASRSSSRKAAARRVPAPRTSRSSDRPFYAQLPAFLAPTDRRFYSATTGVLASFDRRFRDQQRTRPPTRPTGAGGRFVREPLIKSLP